MASKTPYESIRYPINMYGDVKHTTLIGLDIGGSLAKLVYLVEDDQEGNDESKNIKYHMRFVKFETKYIESCLDFIQKHYLNSENSLISNIIYATGGGSIKYKDLIINKLGLQIQKEDEIDCIIKGSIFLIKNIKNECFEFDKEHLPCFIYKDCQDDSAFPFLLTNIGSGVSFVKVESSEKFERLGGTSIGGGTFWGLGSLLTDAIKFDELIDLALGGNSENVDMLVKDIYGGDYPLLNLPKSLIASSFGKCIRSPTEEGTYNKSHFSQKDIARSLLRAISYNIGQLAVLYAKLNGIDKIYFGGHFIRSNFLPVLTISEAVGFYSQAKFSALFFKHDGFLGALGAFHSGILREQQSDRQIHTGFSSTFFDNFGFFEENIATSSFSDYSVTKHQHPIKIHSLDYYKNGSMAFPLLKSGGQISVNRRFILEMVDYINDWVPLFVEEFKKQNELDREKCEKLCTNFSKMIITRLNCYRTSCSLKILNYLNDIFYIQDRFIKEFLVLDPFLKFKHNHNLEAINKFQSFIDHLNTIPDTLERHSVIFNHLFAGNLIDFSSVDVLKHNISQLSHEDCFKKIENLNVHYTGDSFKKWIREFEAKKWKKILILVDKSGYDIVFGIFGLVREFLIAGSDIVLAANTYPSFNDVVCSELSLIVNRLRFICPVIDKECDSHISFVETGFGSPFLNLQSSSPAFCQAAKDVDLIIIDGHSRSLISYFDAKFSCDVLYVGTVTSSVFAKNLDLNLFDSFMKFDA